MPAACAAANASLPHALAARPGSQAASARAADRAPAGSSCRGRWRGCQRTSSSRPGRSSSSCPRRPSVRAITALGRLQPPHRRHQNPCSPAPCRSPHAPRRPSCSARPHVWEGNMFVNDIKGYSDFSADEWQPRPDVYLASYRYARPALLLLCNGARHLTQGSCTVAPLLRAITPCRAPRDVQGEREPLRAGDGGRRRHRRAQDPRGRDDARRDQGGGRPSTVGLGAGPTPLFFL
jgi:hypothetical protein